MAYPEQANMKGWSSEPSIYHHPSNLYSTTIPLIYYHHPSILYVIQPVISPTIYRVTYHVCKG